MRLIDKDALYEKLKADEDLARQRAIDTPNSFPNGSLNPAAVRYMAQLSERTRLKEMVYDAPTIEPERKKARWIKMSDADGIFYACSECGEWHEEISNFCPNCGARMNMRGGQE